MRINTAKNIFLKQHILIPFLLSMLSINVSGQLRYTENWCFFQNHKINFSTSAPVTIDPSALFGWGEGCAAISDKNTGQLLFYTDGKTVYNWNDVVMQNGYFMYGSLSSTQSSLVVPMPGDSMKYYLFTCGDDLYRGLAYSIVDMSLMGGLGAVTTTKNVMLNTVAGEKLTAVQLCNGDYWVLCTNQDNNEFYAYKIATTGISPAVVSAAGSINLYPRQVGQMKFSSDGKKIAKAYYKITSDGITQVFPLAELFDFDLNTGQVSNAIALNIPNGIESYGVEFSPNNNFVYFDAFAGGEVCIYQFDISNFNATAINNSRQSVYCGAPRTSSMQLGMDGKIYKTTLSLLLPVLTPSALDVINNPNEPGAGCNYGAYQIILPTYVTIGLPNFVSSFLVPHPTIPPLNLPDYSVCKNDTVLITAPAGFVGYSWSPDYNISSPNAASINAWPDLDTSYILIATTNEGCSVIDTIPVHVNTAAAINLGNDTSLCKYDSLLLDAGTGFADYLWNTDEHTQSISVATADIFNVIATDNNGCRSTDTLQILNVYDLPVIDLQHEINICKGEHFLVDATLANASYLWQDGSTTPAFEAITNGTYWVNVYVNGCTSSDTVVIKYKDCNCRLVIPNAITPNGDGINDKWILSEGNCFSKVDVYIYNRYGSLVYQKDNYQNDWQGSYKLKNLPDGTYYYIIKALKNDKQQLFKGNITLLR